MQDRQARIFRIAVDATGMATLVLITALFPDRRLSDTLFFILLATVAETQSIWMGDHETISVSSAVMIAAMLICGPAAAVWAAAVCVLGSVTKKGPKIRYTVFNTPVWITIFNISNYVLTVALMGALYGRMGGRLISQGGELRTVLRSITSNSLPLLVSVLTGVLFNAALFGLTLWISGGAGSISQVLFYLLWPTVNLFFICLLGALLTALYAAYGWFLVALFFLPFMLARYVFTTYKDLQQSYLQTVESLASAVEAKDEYTSGHSRRVEKYSAMIAAQMKLSPKRRETLRYAALLHDIGKIGIPESILNKPGRLTEEEWKQIRQHPEKGAHIVEDIAFLSDAVDIIRFHHEWYNGGGYPSGRKAGELPLEAMILCVADSFDAMTSERPYRKAMSVEESVAELRRGAGTQFAPEVVEAFEKALAQGGEMPLEKKTRRRPAVHV